MPLFILSIILQAVLVIHVVKTGRNTTWIWVLVTLPLAGSLAYFVIEILPSLWNSRAGNKVVDTAKSTINQNKGLKDAAHDYQLSDTVAHSLNLADELVSKGLYEQAVALYQKCLNGAYTYDANILHRLALAQFNLKAYSEVKNTLDTLIEHNPEFKNQDAHLLYARTLAALNDADNAIHEYETLSHYFSGPEANYHYAMFLCDQGQREQAKKLLQDIVEYANHSAPHYHTLHKEWIQKSLSQLRLM